MTKVDQGRYGNFRAKLTVDDLHGGDFIPLTIAGFGEETLRGEDGERLTPYLEFKETDKILWINGTQIGYLIDGIGSDDTDDWTGSRIPVEKKSVAYRGVTHHKLWIAEPKDWSKMLAPTNKPKRGK